MAKKTSEVIPFTILAVIFVSLFIISTFFIPFNIYFYFLVLFFVALFILKNPEIGLYSIIILTFIFERFFTLQPIIWGEYTYKIYPLDILTIITCLSLLIYKLHNSEQKIKIGRLSIFIIVFVLFSLFSTFYGISRGGAISLAFSTFKNYAIYSIFFFLVINIIDTPEKLKRLVKVFLIAGAALLFFVFVGWVRRAGFWIEFTPLSTFGTRLLAPTHAFYLSLAALFALNLYAYKKKFFSSLTFPIILVQLLGILGSLSRHLYLALAVSIIISLILIPRQFRRNLFKVILTQVLLIFIFIAIFSWTSYLATGNVPFLGNEIIKSTGARLKTLTLAPEDQSSYFRIFAWQEAWKRFSQKPILGIGFGQRLTFDFFGWSTRIEVRDLHNDFIGIGLQMGIAGFVIFLALNLYFLFSILKNLKKVDNELKPYLLGVLACFILFVIAANFGVYFDINLLVIFYWIILGMGVSMFYLARGRG
ncbi:MAG: O-antigen ligase family protein [Patescibacteria group bacterium]